MLSKILCLVFAVGALQAAELVPAARELREALHATERSMERRFAETSMKLIGRPQGGYLEDFGVVFTLEVNVVPMANVSPFNPGYTEEQLLRLNQRKRERLDDLKTLATDILVNEAVRLEAVPRDGQIALVISLFHFTWEKTTGLPSQVVFQAKRDDLLNREAGRLSESALSKKVEARYF